MVSLPEDLFEHISTVGPYGKSSTHVREFLLGQPCEKSCMGSSQGSVRVADGPMEE